MHLFPFQVCLPELLSAHEAGWFLHDVLLSPLPELLDLEREERRAETRQLRADLLVARDEIKDMHKLLMPLVADKQAIVRGAFVDQCREKALLDIGVTIDATDNIFNLLIDNEATISCSFSSAAWQVLKEGKAAGNNIAHPSPLMDVVRDAVLAVTDAARDGWINAFEVHYKTHI